MLVVVEIPLFTPLTRLYRAKEICAYELLIEDDVEPGLIVVDEVEPGPITSRTWSDL